MNIEKLKECFKDTLNVIKIHKGDYHNMLEEIVQILSVGNSNKLYKALSIALIGPPCSKKSKIMEFFVRK